MKPLFFSLVPVVAAIVAATIAILHQPSAALKSVTQHLAAGVVFAAVALEMGPDLLKRHESVSTALGFCIGVILVVAICYFTEKPDEERETGTSSYRASYAITIGTDPLVDGLMIGIGFTAGAKAGLLLTVALTLELVSLSLALISQLLDAGRTRLTAIGTTAALAMLVPVGAIIGAKTLVHMPDPVVNGTIAAGTAALLYLVVEELMREAHEQPESPLITATFFLGFLVVLLIDMQLA